MSQDPRARTGVTTPRGFRAAGVGCGIRKDQPDLALLVSEREASAAAVFTRNLVQAAPIGRSRSALEASGGRARAIVVNSGNANACTGPAGDENARRTVEETARLISVPAELVLVASTGVIGEQLPVERILGALPGAVAELSPTGGSRAAAAILTTDTFSKETARTVGNGSQSYLLGGMAKGSGMIHPDMATTLAFVTTDASIAPEKLQPILQRTVDRSFNRISVDGETSTNDMVAVLANGAAGTELERPEDLNRFEDALLDVLVDLARSVVRDGEGATKLITIRVRSALSEATAVRIARTISTSPLVKTAVHGADANWGRIVAAAGRAGVPFEPERVSVSIGELPVLRPGYSCEFSEEEATELLEQKEVVITVDLGQGSESATTWTCDLTSEYVSINAHYRT